jgi:TolB protein
MKRLKIIAACALLGYGCVNSFAADVVITNYSPMGATKPILVSVSGITGEALQVLQFDLYVQGFAFTNAEAAQYLLSGSSNGSLQGRVTDNINKQSLLSKAYSGASIRRQVHAFADDFVQALGRKPICQTKIAFKIDTGPTSEIYISDFDGHNEQAVTKDNNLVAAPDWVPGKFALYYVSYVMGNPSIFHHDLSSGSRKAFARYGGSNISPAASPDGTHVAMILSKDGWTDLYVSRTDGSDLRRLTKSREDESSPCWSPDSQYICFAAKINERRSLCKVPVGGGQVQRINTIGVSNPTEPDWSPDGKWIVFTSMGRGFDICVVPSQGGEAMPLVSGEDPTWAPNSRTVIFAKRQGGRRMLSLLDVFTKQNKDVSRFSGSSSQSQPSWAR